MWCIVVIVPPFCFTGHKLLTPIKVLHRARQPLSWVEQFEASGLWVSSQAHILSWPSNQSMAGCWEVPMVLLVSLGRLLAAALLRAV